MNVAIRGIDGRIAQGDVPPVRNANFAWVQYLMRHLAPGTTRASCWPTAPCPTTLPHTTCRLHVRP